MNITIYLTILYLKTKSYTTKYLKLKNLKNYLCIITVIQILMRKYIYSLNILKQLTYY